MAILENAENTVISGSQFTNNIYSNGQPTTPSGHDLLLRHSITSARLDSNERRQENPAKCHPSTRVAVIAEVMQWIEDRPHQGPSMMRMHGPAGTGKTALAQTIGELCKENGLLAASFFFSRTALGRNTGQSLLPTLAYQLTISYPEARYAIRKRIEDDPSLLDQSIQTIMDELLIASFCSWFCIIPCWITGSFLFQTAFNWVRPRLVVIDGLDECEDPRIQCDILRALATATKRLRLPFRFLVTSRPEPHIMQEFDGEPIFKSIDLIMLNLADRNAEDDIRIYLIEEFKCIRTVHPLGPHLPSSWPDHEAISEITRKASGQFVYAAVVINYLQSRKHSPKDRLNTILGISSKPSHDSPFAQLDGLYAHILSSAQDDNLDDLRLILGILASEVQSHRKDDGLWTYNSPDVIEKLLSLDTGRVDHLLDDLRSLISFNGRDQPMKFFHASLSDFLLDPKRSGKFHVAADFITEALAKGYLRLLQIQAEHHLCYSRRNRLEPLPEHAKLISLLLTSIGQWKTMVISRALVDDLRSFDFSVVIKSLFHTFPTNLQPLKAIWTSRVLQDMLHFLEDTGINLGPLIKNIDRDFPLEESIFASLQEFLERPRFKEYFCQHCSSVKSERVALQRVLYVPILHYLLTIDSHSDAATLEERCIGGVRLGLLHDHSLRELLDARDEHARNEISRQIGPLAGDEPSLQQEFNIARTDSISILLAHASYSYIMVELLRSARIYHHEVREEFRGAVRAFLKRHQERILLHNPWLLGIMNLKFREVFCNGQVHIGVANDGWRTQTIH